MTARGIDFTGLAYLTGIALVAFVAYQVIRNGKGVAQAATDLVGKVVDTVGPAINPASPENLAYKGATAITRAATGNTTDTFGTWLYGLLNKDPLAELDMQNAKIFGKPPSGAAPNGRSLLDAAINNGFDLEGAAFGLAVMPSPDEALAAAWGRLVSDDAEAAAIESASHAAFGIYPIPIRARVLN